MEELRVELLELDARPSDIARALDRLDAKQGFDSGEEPSTPTLSFVANAVLIADAARP